MPKRKTNLQEKFIDEMSKPDTKNRTQAVLKAGYSKNYARQTAAKLFANPDIVAEIEKRKLEAAKSCQITREQVLGATVLRAFATIDDAYDENGNFSFEKARRTGAIHLIKSITRTPNQFGESIKVEFYDKANAQDKLANYLSLEKEPEVNAATLNREAKEKFLAAVALLVAEGDDEKAAKDFVIRAYPESAQYLN